MAPAVSKTPHHSSAHSARRLSADDRRQQILDMAAQLFIQRGFEGVRMADLAQALGTSRPTIYGYFASTEEMLSGLLEQQLDGLPERLRPYLLQGPGRFRALFGALLQERELLLLLNAGGGPLFRQKRQEFLLTVQERLNITELPRAQRHAAEQPYLALIVMELLGALSYAQLSQGELDTTQLSRHLNDFIEGGLAAVTRQT
ncbi:TetR/AcrR family transcriptional regulator [Deinococcus radiophilus]|uniref:TetR/AcrR family transcriptional regulator n=3 Tax=Deinococcus radiophilus TaxID=32062 RepID=A0A431VXP4_9DEIO|nr:TetR/AcrR family transcriptional regulator [Deinococcus radiophilus]RTR28004.1 TetR/AcrR family transcriptional regulator [Deinococcus radiophilus]UFA51549.1 TetR/AcrR family transcriptional regulator [Deinococcus radiophilus]